MDVNELIDNLRMPSWHDLEDPDATLLADAADALSTLQAENEKLRDELDQVKRERDAVIDQLHGYCFFCANNTPSHNEGPCRACKHEYYHLLNNEYLDNWQWRGSKKED